MRNDPPSISIIVPAYGVAHLLGDALKSLQKQDFQDWEAIVIDDGAPDDVAGAVAAFSGDPRIRFLATDNGGLAVARNRAIASARAPLVSLLDGDDIYEPDYLSAMIGALDADPDLGFVTCDATLFGMPRREGHRFSRDAPQMPPITLERVLSRAFNIFVGCTIRREAIDSVGGFDGALRSAEDLDLWIRLLAAGWRCGHVARPLVRYRRRPDSLSADTGGLLRATEQVYAKAERALHGRPEAATAARMRASVLQQLDWLAGEAMIRQGRSRDGIALLTSAGADRRSRRWRITMPLMRLAPGLAPLLIDMRHRLPRGAERSD